MSQFDNTPIIPPASEVRGPAGWLSVWMKVVTKPGEQTFIEITEHPDISSRTAYIWVFLSYALSIVVAGIIQSILIASGLNNQLGVEGAGASVGTTVFVTICASPITGAISVLFFALMTAITQWIAKLFGGTGNYDKLLYAFAAIFTPYTLASIFLIPLSSVPYLNICTGLFSFGLILYYLFLKITAVKAINGFGWGQAIGAVMLPSLASLFVCGCIAVASFMLLAPMIGNVFSSINQSLQFVP